MFERFTDKSILVIQFAQSEASRLGHTEVSPEFIFLGLISIKSSIPSKLLKQLGVELTKSRMELEKQLDRGPGFREKFMPLSSETKRLIGKAWKKAKQPKSMFVGPEHLLLALLDLDHRPTLSLIKAVGLVPDKLEELVLREMGNSSQDEDGHPAKPLIYEEFYRALDVVERSHQRAIEWHHLDFAEKLKARKQDLIKLFLEIGELIQMEHLQEIPWVSKPPEKLSSDAPSTSGEISKDVLVVAQEEARRLGHNFIGSETILLGLIAAEGGIASTALKAFGINLEDARVEVERIVGFGSDSVGSQSPYTPRARKILERAWDESRRLGHKHIGTEHLLIAMIRERDGVAPRVLENLGVDLGELELHVLSLGKEFQ